MKKGIMFEIIDNYFWNEIFVKEGVKKGFTEKSKGEKNGKRKYKMKHKEVI